MTEAGANGVPSGQPMSLARLSVAFILIALTTSRLSLVIHEFIGHGGLVFALGSDIDDFRLFLFGGGWVRFHRAPAYSLGESLAISVAGVVLELAVGIALLVGARFLRAGSPLRLLAVAFGAIDVLHALYYAVAGTHHGYGDGRILHELLGASRPFAVAAGSVVLCGLGVWLSRRFVREVGGWLCGAPPWRQLTMLAAAALAAGAVHGGLLVAERAIAADPTYAELMKHQNRRTVDHEVSRRQRAAPLSAGELRALRVALEQQHRQFPLKTVLLIALAMSLAAGAVIAARRPSPASGRPLGWTGLSPLALACGLALLIVLVLREPWWR